MPSNLTLTCPTTNKPFDLGMAILPGAMLTVDRMEVKCDQCSETHTVTIVQNVPALVPEPPTN
jgi:hypothetical protein